MAFKTEVTDQNTVRGRRQVDPETIQMLRFPRYGRRKPSMPDDSEVYSHPEMLERIMEFKAKYII